MTIQFLTNDFSNDPEFLKLKLDFCTARDKLIAYIETHTQLCAAVSEEKSERSSQGALDVLKLRKSKNLTAKELADMACVSVRTLRRIESKQKVSEPMYRSVAFALGCTAADLRPTSNET